MWEAREEQGKRKSQLWLFDRAKIAADGKEEEERRHHLVLLDMCEYEELGLRGGEG